MSSTDKNKDTVPFYKIIPEHDGHHHVFEKVFPQRPYLNSHTSTIEAVWADDYMTNSCQHRKDYELWHGRYENGGQLLYSSCINSITALVDHDYPIDMIVLEGGQRILHNAVEPKLYRIPLPTARGLNHIMWCDNMEITHWDHRYLENIVPKLPEIPTRYINQRVVATVSFPEIGDGIRYKKLGEQPHFTRQEMSPGEYAGSRTVISHVPYLEETTKKGESIPTGIRIKPRWINLVTLNGTPPSLFAQAYLKSSTHIDEIWAQEGRVPPFLNERYIQLRYKPNVNAMPKYAYTHDWEQGKDIRDLFDKRPPPNYMDMGRYYDYQ